MVAARSLRLLSVAAFAALASTLSLSTPKAFAQEVLSKEVDLGTSMFTIEDLENLSAATNLSKEQREAAMELMRGGMARARGLALKSARKAMDWSDMDPEDMENMTKRMEEWREGEKKKADDLLEVEKSVMNELKLLLEGDQAGDGWAKFERSRRRLLMRGVPQTLMMVARDDEGGYGAMSYYGGMGRGMPELIGAVRASKLDEADLKAIAETLELYETSMDSLVKEYRSLAAPLLSKGANMWMMHEDGDKGPGVDGDKIKDIAKRMQQTHVRHAKLVAEALSSEARERFNKQRLRTEFEWRWQPSKRSPQVRSVLKLRSLSEKQREQINDLVKKTDTKLIDLAAKGLAAQDESILLDKKENENPWETEQTPAAMERARDEAKARAQLVKDIVALLSDEQRNAYETGIENDDDLKTAFEKRRHGQSMWEGMSELYGESYSPWGSSEEEEMP